MASNNDTLPRVDMVVMNTSPQAVLDARKERQTGKEQSNQQNDISSWLADEVAHDIRNIGRSGFKNPAQFQEFMNTTAGKMTQQIIMEAINARRLEEQAQREAMERQMRRQQGMAWFLFLSMLWSKAAHAKWIESYAHYNQKGTKKNRASQSHIKEATAVNLEYVEYQRALNTFIDDMQVKIDALQVDQARLAEDQTVLEQKAALFSNVLAEVDALIALSPEEMRQAESMSDKEVIALKALKAAKILNADFKEEQARSEEEMMNQVQIYLENGMDLLARLLLAEMQAMIVKRAYLEETAAAPDLNQCETVDHEGTSYQFQCPLDKKVVYDHEHQCHALIGAQQNLHEFSLQDRQDAHKAFKANPQTKCTKTLVKDNGKIEHRLHRERMVENVEELNRLTQLQETAIAQNQALTKANQQVIGLNIIPKPKPSPSDETPEIQGSYRQTSQKLHRNAPTPSPRPIRRDSRAVQMENYRHRKAPVGRHMTPEEQQEALRNKHNMGTSTHVQDKLQPLSKHTPMPNTDPEQAPNKHTAPTPFSTKPHPKG